MNKLLSIFILIGGVILIAYGIHSWNSLSSDFSRLFTGSPVDKAVWLLIGGVIAAAVGIVGIVRSPRIL